MPLQIKQLNSEPYITESILKGLKPKVNYVFSIKGFNRLLRAAKNYHIVDVILNDGVFDRKTTVELIINHTNDGIMKYTDKNTKEVIAECIKVFTPIMDTYAQQMKTDEITAVSDIQPINFHLVLSDILGYDSIFRACIPCTQFASLIKHEEDITGFLKDILYYMISSRPDFRTSGKNLYKVYATIILVHHLGDEQVNKIWNQGSGPANNG